MTVRLVNLLALGSLVGVVLGTPALSLANGGPFLVKYPNGDPAAKGNPARLDAGLKPGREERLRVLREDLKVTFGSDRPPGMTARAPASTPPVAHVSAAYTIENPTGQEIEIDFGFPILRGIYVHPLSMMPKADVRVLLDGKDVPADIISNSVIYGLIRQGAREVIEAAVARDPTLRRHVAVVRSTGMVRQRAAKTVRDAAEGDIALKKAVAMDRLLAGLLTGSPDTRDADHEQARIALADCLTGAMKWNPRDVTLMVEYASLDFGFTRMSPPDRDPWTAMMGTPMNNLAYQNLGPLAAIGEQKATQFFARLAACFDPNTAATYESIFAAWGGDVRERSVDLGTGEVRPREIAVDPNNLGAHQPFAMGGGSDPTVYARVDYLDPKADLTGVQRASCRTVLKNLPVIFTFAPMNLVHYRVKFSARTPQVLTVTYKQYAYRDTREPASYQLAYVVHPASMWKEFGPIHLDVTLPPGVPFRASVPCRASGTEDRPADLGIFPGGSGRAQPFAIYKSVLTEKTGELFLAVNAKAWDQWLAGAQADHRPQQAARRDDKGVRR